MKTALLMAGCAALFAAPALADYSVNYTVDAGGNNANGLGGLSAAATFNVSGTTLTVLLQNTSTGVPAGAEAADQLLVSVAFNLTGGTTFLSGDAAVIGGGSVGLGAWAGLVAGDSVASQWLWTNEFGGDLLGAYAQVISTSEGFGGGAALDFNGNAPAVSGPFGGIAAAPPFVAIPGSQEAVSDSILFTLTLSSTISEADLQAIADASIVEFGSDYQYMTVPAPGALALLGLGGLVSRRRRR
jgi:hypothetical protein